MHAPHLLLLMLAASPLTSGALSAGQDHLISLEDQVAARQQLASQRSDGGTLSIDGSQTPYLLYRWELVGRLIYTALAADPETRDLFRADIDANLIRAGRPRVDWSSLGTAFSLAVAVHSEANRLAMARSRADARVAAELQDQIEQLQQQECRLRSEGARMAAATLGPALFDDLLYLGIAPSTHVVILASADTLESNRHIEEGCR